MSESSSSSIRSRKKRQLAIVYPNIHTGLHSMTCRQQNNLYDYAVKCQPTGMSNRFQSIPIQAQTFFYFFIFSPTP